MLLLLFYGAKIIIFLIVLSHKNFKINYLPYNDDEDTYCNNGALHEKYKDFSVSLKNDTSLIEGGIDELYGELQGKEGMNRAFDLNINYLLFQLIHLATELDDTVNQEEIIQYITDQTSEDVFLRGSHQHMKKFF